MLFIADACSRNNLARCPVRIKRSLVFAFWHFFLQKTCLLRCLCLKILGKSANPSFSRMNLLLLFVMMKSAKLNYQLCKEVNNSKSVKIP